MQTSKGVQITQESKAQKRVTFALIFILENVYQITQVTCVQIGRGIAKIPATRRGGSRTVILWHKDPEEHVTMTTDTDSNVRCSDLSEEHWAESYCISADHYENSSLPLDDCLRSAGTEDDDQTIAPATGGSKNPSVNDRLSTIPEETEDSEPFWVEEDLSPEEIINELSLLGFLERFSEIDEKPDSEIQVPTRQDEHPHVEPSPCLEVLEGSSYLSAGADPTQYAQADRDDRGNVFISFDNESDMHKLFTPVNSKEDCTVIPQEEQSYNAILMC